MGFFDLKKIKESWKKKSLKISNKICLEKIKEFFFTWMYAYGQNLTVWFALKFKEI